MTKIVSNRTGPVTPAADGTILHRHGGLRRYPGLLKSLGVLLLGLSFGSLRRRHSPQHYLTVCAIAKNEGRYFEEWIAHHAAQGVSKFYIYDNESSDDTRVVLQPHIERGLVEYRFIPGERQQLNAYQDCLDRHRFDARWIAFIDIDEFIVPKRHVSVVDFLRGMEQFAAVEINWLIFGSSGHEKRLPGSVMQRFTRHSLLDYEQNRLVKSIVDPRKILAFFGAHRAVRLFGKAADATGSVVKKSFWHRPPAGQDIIRIHHYAVKSREEFMEKRARGRARPGSLRNDAYFKRYDKNEVDAGVEPSNF